jgi:type II secretory pathway component GspD/PulD (secretin)
VWVDGKNRNVPMPLPVIGTRQMQASADVYDGQTLVLGSLDVSWIQAATTNKPN